MQFPGHIDNYEVRGVGEIKQGKNGNAYFILNVENPEGYPCRITCRDVNCRNSIKRGDLISCDCVFVLTDNYSYVYTDKAPSVQGSMYADNDSKQKASEK